MTENEARTLVLDIVPRETGLRLEAYVSLLRAAARAQNLIAVSTLETIWARHILDSQQLLALAPGQGLWIDIGSGAGLPGLVIAAIAERPVMLLEPRAKRCAFLHAAAQAMGISDRVQIVQSRIETAADARAIVISARAVAALPKLFEMGHRFATSQTVWLLPKGRSAASEVADVRRSWHANLKLVPSVTDSEAAIVVATDVVPRRRS